MSPRAGSNSVARIPPAPGPVRRARWDVCASDVSPHSWPLGRARGVCLFSSPITVLSTGVRVGKITERPSVINFRPVSCVQRARVGEYIPLTCDGIRSRSRRQMEGENQTVIWDKPAGIPTETTSQRRRCRADFAETELNERCEWRLKA